MTFLFVLYLSLKSGDWYQIGRGILPDTRRPILYHVMRFVQWPRAKINRWVISIFIFKQEFSFKTK